MRASVRALRAARSSGVPIFFFRFIVKPNIRNFLGDAEFFKCRGIIPMTFTGTFAFEALNLAVHFIDRHIDRCLRFTGNCLLSAQDRSTPMANGDLRNRAIFTALSMLAPNLNRLAVVEEGKLVGIVTRHDLLQYIKIHSELEG